MRIEVSREDELLLDTGGGLKKAAWFFLQSGAAGEEAFLLHNVDVVSTIDLGRMVEAHGKGSRWRLWPFSVAIAVACCFLTMSCVCAGGEKGERFGAGASGNC